MPSDLEQMPNLLDALKRGVVSGNHYTPLISHTATDLLTALTGLYGERMGAPVSNSYRVFEAGGHPSKSHSVFHYWTAVAASDNLPVLLGEDGKTAPAPWVAFTRAGCDVGAYSTANMVFENTLADLKTVYGESSREYIKAKADFEPPAKGAKQNAQWLGVALHCARESPRCAKGRPDLLPDEAGGYERFNALFGHVNVQPEIAPAGLRDLDGNSVEGFSSDLSPSAAQTLGYLAAMLEAGVPVVYGYIADAHDNRDGSGSFGPGESDYVAQLKAYDAAFGKFFARLAKNGIDASNTVFLVTADENDHFVGGPPTPAGRDGLRKPCAYVEANGARSIGAFRATLDSLLYSQSGRAPPPFLVQADVAPPIYIDGDPKPTDSVTRALEKDIASLTLSNPPRGRRGALAAFIADRAEMKFLHMVTASPSRTPSFVVFGDPDYIFVTSRGALPLAPRSDCAATPANCVTREGDAWTHGDVQQDITRTWFGLVGPGVKKLGRDDSLFSDHTDLRPTLLALLGLKDDYLHDGRVLAEFFTRAPQPGFVALARVYKQLNAPLGALGQDSLKAATRAIKGDDAGYAAYLAATAPILAERDALAGEIKQALRDAAFEGKPPQRAAQLIARARDLLARVKRLARAG